MAKQVSQESSFQPKCIVSGGQTGVDRAAFDAAIALGIEHGGWCPKGRLAEDGTVPSRYNVREHSSSAYAARTQQNVADSDATLILYEGKLSGGTRLTVVTCQRLEKPHLVIRIEDDPVDAAKRWLDTQRPETLNVAGPRGSGSPGIYDRSLVTLLRILEK